MRKILLSLGGFQVGATLLLDLIEHYSDERSFSRVFGDLEVLRANGGAVSVLCNCPSWKSRFTLLSIYWVRIVRYRLKLILTRRVVSNRSHFTFARIFYCMLRLNLWPNRETFETLIEAIASTGTARNNPHNFVLFHNAILPEEYSGYTIEDWFLSVQPVAVLVVNRDPLTQRKAACKGGLFERTKLRFGRPLISLEQFIEDSRKFREQVNSWCTKNHCHVIEFEFDDLLRSPQREMARLGEELGIEFNLDRGIPDWLEISILNQMEARKC